MANKAILNAFAESNQKYEEETVSTSDNQNLSFIFIMHATLAIVYNGKTIFIDPVKEYADFELFPKADVILITHEHFDHYDPEAVEAIRTKSSVVIGSASVVQRDKTIKLLSPGGSHKISDDINVLGVHAYNTGKDKQKFHPKSRNDLGYIIELGKTRIYVPGDTEPIPEMKEFGQIDIAFLPVNQPYTMTINQAVEAAKTIKPKIFFPYHYSGTPIKDLVKPLSGTGIDVRIHNMQ